jgi:hypothetical protein
MTARCHAADEHTGVGGVVLHPNPVAKNCAAREWRRRIDR